MKNKFYNPKSLEAVRYANIVISPRGAGKTHYGKELFNRLQKNGKQ